MPPPLSTARHPPRPRLAAGSPPGRSRIPIEEDELNLGQAAVLGAALRALACHPSSPARWALESLPRWAQAHCNRAVILRWCSRTGILQWWCLDAADVGVLQLIHVCIFYKPHVCIFYKLQKFDALRSIVGRGLEEDLGNVRGVGEDMRHEDL